MYFCTFHFLLIIVKYIICIYYYTFTYSDSINRFFDGVKLTVSYGKKTYFMTSLICNFSIVNLQFFAINGILFVYITENL